MKLTHEQLVEAIADRVHADWVDAWKKHGTAEDGPVDTQELVPYAQLSERRKAHTRRSVESMLRALYELTR